MSVISNKVDPGLRGVPETLLIPLWARAIEQSRPDPLIHDPDAARIVDSLNYDFSTFESKGVEAENFCVRSRVIDEVVSQVLSRHPGTPVVEFGPGLDTRFQRVGHLAEHWLEVDLPEVIELRQQFFDANPSRQVAGCSMLDEDWMSNLEPDSPPPLFIAEGVFYFFSHEQIKALLATIATNFPGASFIFDAISSWYLKFSNLRHPLKSSTMQFALRAGATELPEWDSRWSIQQYVGYGDSPWYDQVMHRFEWWKRAAVKLLPIARHAFMIVHADSAGKSEKTS